MKAKGHVFKYGDNVDTDVIIPARYLNSFDAQELASHAMADIDPEFVKLDKKLYKGERHMLKVRDKNYRDKFYMMEEARFDYLKGLKGKYKGGNKNEKNK